MERKSRKGGEQRRRRRLSLFFACVRLGRGARAPVPSPRLGLGVRPALARACGVRDPHSCPRAPKAVPARLLPAA